MRIGELSRRTGVHERLLRYYEEQDLLHPERLPSGYREYREGDVHTVSRIRGLLAAGLNTATIATILPCMREETDRLVPTCPDLLLHLFKERDRITQAIQDLQTSREALTRVIEAAPAEVARSSVGPVEPDVSPTL